MTIVFLYSRLQPFLFGVIQSMLLLNKNLKIKIIYFDSSNKKYLELFNSSNNIQLYNRKKFNKKDLVKFLVNSEPTIVYLSGWMDLSYLTATILYKKTNPACKTLIGIDDLWYGSFRQLVGSFIFRFIIKKYIDYMWVAGTPQYHYARKFGYNDNNIISNLLPCNSFIFTSQAKFSKRLVFVGRNVWQKNLHFLIETYNSMPLEFKVNWPLCLYGPSKEDFKLLENDYLFFYPDLNPSMLSQELSKGGVLILPSISEKWGVVVHELASIGYPLIISDACGSAYDLLINGFNGYKFVSNSKLALIKVLNNLEKLSSIELQNMSNNSVLISKKYNSEMAAYSLLSIVEEIN